MSVIVSGSHPSTALDARGGPQSAVLTHSCPPFQHLLSERLTSLDIMGAPRCPHYAERRQSLGTSNVGTVGMNWLTRKFPCLANRLKVRSPYHAEKGSKMEGICENFIRQNQGFKVILIIVVHINKPVLLIGLHFFSMNE